MADPVMQAYVEFRAADSARLKADAKTQAAEASKSAEVQIPAKLDTKPLDRQRAELQGKLRALSAHTVDIAAKIGVDDKDGRAKVASFQARLAAIGNRVTSAKLTLEGADKAEAQLLAVRAAMLRTEAASGRMSAGLKDVGDEADTTRGKMSRLDDALSRMKGAGPAWLAALPAAIPAIGGLLPVVGGLGVSFAAAGGAALTFGALAKSVLSQAGQDAKKYQELTTKLAGATTAAQKQAIQKQITALTQSWTPAYRQLLGATTDLKAQWKTLSIDLAAPALVPWMDAVAQGMQHLRPLVKPVADVFLAWGQTVDRYFKSRAGSAEVDRLAAALGKFSAGQLKAIGTFLGDMGRAVFNLGRLLAAHDVDFGAFGKHLDAWGAAFLRWSSSAGARKAVTDFLNWVHANGPVVQDLIKNLGTDLKNLAPGLSAVGALELKVITDFLGFVAKLPPGVAKPLVEVAGAALLLSKLPGGTKVISFSVKLLGLGAGLLMKAVGLGGLAAKIGLDGTGAAVKMEAAFETGGTSAAAKMEAALAGGGGLGKGGAAAAAGKEIGAAAGTALVAAGGVALGVAAGAALALYLQKYTKDLKPPPAGQVGSRGGFQSPTDAQRNAWKQYDKAVTDTGIAVDVTKAKLGQAAGMINDRVNKSLAASGTHADALRINHLGPLGSKIDSVNGQAKRLGGQLDGGLGKSAAAGGAHTDTFKNAHLGPLGSKLASVDQQTRTLGGDITKLPANKTVTLQMMASGSGGVKVQSPGIAAKLIQISKLAAGGRITAGTGPKADDVPIMASRGEYVVNAAATARHLPVIEAINAGRYADGGLVALDRQAVAFPRAVEAATSAATRDALTADLTQVLRDMKNLLSGGSGAAVLKYAMQYLHKVPYAWGGDTPSGWDCSGYLRLLGVRPHGPVQGPHHRSGVPELGPRVAPGPRRPRILWHPRPPRRVRGQREHAAVRAEPGVRHHPHLAQPRRQLRVRRPQIRVRAESPRPRRRRVTPGRDHPGIRLLPAEPVRVGRPVGLVQGAGRTRSELEHVRHQPVVQGVRAGADGRAARREPRREQGQVLRLRREPQHLPGSAPRDDELHRAGLRVPGRRVGAVLPAPRRGRLVLRGRPGRRGARVRDRRVRRGQGQIQGRSRRSRRQGHRPRQGRGQAGRRMAEGVADPPRRRVRRRVGPRRRQRADRPHAGRDQPGDRPVPRRRPDGRAAPVLGRVRREPEEAARRPQPGTEHRTGVARPPVVLRRDPRPVHLRSGEHQVAAEERRRVESADETAAGHHQRHLQDARLLRRVPQGPPAAAGDRRGEAHVRRGCRRHDRAGPGAGRAVRPRRPGPVLRSRRMAPQGPLSRVQRHREAGAGRRAVRGDPGGVPVRERFRRVPHELAAEERQDPRRRVGASGFWCQVTR